MTRSLGGTELKRLHRDWRRRNETRLALFLDGVQNPFNVGAIMRTAAAYSVEHIWMVGGPSPDDTKVNKTALGSQKFLTWTACETAAGAIADIRSKGYRIIGVELAEGALPLHDLDLSGDICLVLGHEDRGLSKDMLADNDALGYIPQLGRIGSLNVGTAAAIACYETRRTGWTAQAGPPSLEPAALNPQPQTRSGSISIRSRPAGRGTAEITSHKIW